MRAEPQPDLNAKLTPAEQGRLRREVIVQSLNAQAQWLDGVMKKLLPKQLYRMAHDQSGTVEQFEERQKTVKQWLDRNDVRIVQKGLVQVIYKGRERLSRFVVRVAEK